jgi:hypothetical protein
LPVRTVRARATYVIFAPLRVFLGFDSDHDNYYLADRGDKDYYEADHRGDAVRPAPRRH